MKRESYFRPSVIVEEEDGAVTSARVDWSGSYEQTVTITDELLTEEDYDAGATAREYVDGSVVGWVQENGDHAGIGVDLFALVSAVDDVRSLHSDVWFDTGPRFTCSEADALVGLLRAVGLDCAADALEHGHALEDQTGDSHYLFTVDHEGDEVTA